MVNLLVNQVIMVSQLLNVSVFVEGLQPFSTKIRLLIVLSDRETCAIRFT